MFHAPTLHESASQVGGCVFGDDELRSKTQYLSLSVFVLQFQVVVVLVMALISSVQMVYLWKTGTTCFVGGDCRTYLKLARAHPLSAKALASSLVHEGDQNSIFYAHETLAAALPLSFRHDQRGMWSSFPLWNSVTTPRDQIAHSIIPSIWSDSGDRFVLTSVVLHGGVLPDSRAI